MDVLNDNTKLIYGLAESANPDNVFQTISSFLFGSTNTYRWLKTKSIASFDEASVENRFTSANVSLSVTNAVYTIKYSSSLSANSDGVISLVNPSSKTYTITSRNYKTIGTTINADLKNKYITVTYDDSTTDVYKFSKFDAYNDDGYNIDWYGYKVTGSVTNLSEIVTSDSSDTYTDGSTDSDGYLYTSIAPILAKVALMETGTYIGTGTYGSSNKNSLTFSFVPQLVIIFEKDLASIGSSSSGNYGTIMLNGNAKARTGEYTTAHYINITWNDKTVSWYCSNTNGGVSGQLNISKQEYLYLALG